MITKTNHILRSTATAPDAHPARRARRCSGAHHRRRARRTLGLCLGALAVLSIGPTAQASTSRCAASSMHVVSSGSQGAAGTQFAALRFEHPGPGSCTLGGFPGIALVNGGHRYATNVRRSPTGPVRTVRVDASHPAYFDLSYRADGSGGRSCRARVTGLRVIPPNERRALPVTLRPRPVRLCLDSVRVQAVRSTSRLHTASRTHASGVRNCGFAGYVFRGQVRIGNVTSRNVACGSARSFARAFETKSGAQSGYSCSEDAVCTFRGWTCRNTVRNASSADHRCVNGNRVVRWQTRS